MIGETRILCDYGMRERVSQQRRVLTGGDPSGADIAASHRPANLAISADRQVAVVLIQKRVKPLVLRRRQVKHRQEIAIAAARFSESRIDQVDEILPPEFVRLEGLIDDRPEIIPRRKLSQQPRNDRRRLLGGRPCHRRDFTLSSPYVSVASPLIALQTA